MTENQSNDLPATVKLTHHNRQAILDKVLVVLGERFYAQEKLDREWYEAAERHRPQIERAEDAEYFEEAMSELLGELQTSHLGFFHGSARRASARAALSATYLADDTPYGRRWILQDVHAGGAAALAGIESGNILLRVDNTEIHPPEHPVFPMGEQTTVEIVANDDSRRTSVLEVARPKGKKLHFIEPELVEARQLEDEVGYLKVAMFPGMVGVQVANAISNAVEGLGSIDRLVIDLRGNTGGGIGALRVMSLLTPDKIPVGFALDRRQPFANLEAAKKRFPRFAKIPSSTTSLWPLALKFAPAMIRKVPIVLETEGLGRKSFHGKIILLVNSHTASAAEMIVAFARENRLATIVGESTAGHLLSATSVSVGHGFRLALPTGTYCTWQGTVLEGNPLKPDVSAPFDWQQRRTGVDGPLQLALEHSYRM